MGLVRSVMEISYRSFLGRGMSLIARQISKLKQPHMIYGYYDVRSSVFRKYTRISDTALIMSPKSLSIKDYVWIWHYSIVDATEGLEIGEGCQIGAWVGIFTHGSHISIRLYGKDYVNVPSKERYGYTRGAVKIGDYSFIGAGTIILPNVSIGKGSIIAACSLVNQDVPDYSIVTGCPGKIVGNTKDLDSKYINEDIAKTYYDREVFEEIYKDRK
jgi:acetyltransferase-like isoleucine patch superfamily enzyme